MITRPQIRAALALLNMTVTDFSKCGDVPSQNAISRYLREPETDMWSTNLKSIKRRLEELGVEFSEDGNGVRLKDKT